MKPKENIDISIVASSIRPYLWWSLYDSLYGNKVNWEIIFVGDNKPSFKLPDKIKFIYSTVKPAQCYEIGFRVARGELIHWSVDEAIYNYIRPNNLDNIYKRYHKSKERKLILGFTVKENNGQTFSITSKGHKMPNGEWVASFGVISREFMKELGGYDKRFITGQAENDLCMRVYNMGGIISCCKDAIVAVYHNIGHTDTNSKFRKWYPENRDFLDKCWKSGKKRLIPFEPFPSKNILTEGEW